MNSKLFFSSKTNEWYTPQYLFDELNKEFNFTLDPCATLENHKCEKILHVKRRWVMSRLGGKFSILQSSIRS